LIQLELAEWRGRRAPADLLELGAQLRLAFIFAGVTLFLGVAFIERGESVFLYFNF